jgi:hypothetical protein
MLVELLVMGMWSSWQAFVVEVMWGTSLLSVKMRTVVEDKWWELLLCVQKVPDSFLSCTLTAPNCCFPLSWFPPALWDGRWLLHTSLTLPDWSISPVYYTANKPINHDYIHSLPCAECDNSLLFSTVFSVPVCDILFTATLLHLLFFNPPSLHLVTYFLVYLLVLFPNSHTILFWEF